MEIPRLCGRGFTVGPDFGPKAVMGVLAPRVLGSSAQPVRAFDVDGDEVPCETLYLGGSADPYLLVGQCSNDLVEFVSVGSTLLEIIDQVPCRSADLPQPRHGRHVDEVD